MINALDRAVLWDMDGTLIHSGHYHFFAWRDILAKEDYHLTEENFALTFGQRSDEALRYYFGDSISAKKIDEIIIAKEQCYREMVSTQGIILAPGAQDWLIKLKSQGWYQVLATSAPLLNVEAILAVIDIGHFFDAIVAGEDVPKGKPDPAVFYTAANKVSVPTHRCIVLEDAPVGIEAAHRAGMPVIGILSTHPTLTADFVVNSLEDLPPDIFERLLKPNL